MATIAPTNIKTANGPITATVTVLTASDTFIYTPNGRQLMHLFNTTASPVVVTFDGSGGTTISPPGYGGTIDVSAGKAVTVPANGTVALNLDTISSFLQGTIAVTGGVGVTATLYNFI
jgi:hypothetical protein